MKNFPIRRASLAAAAIFCAGASSAGVPAAWIDQASQPRSADTDRLIVKYRDASETRQVGVTSGVMARALPAAVLDARVAAASVLTTKFGVGPLRLLRQMGTGAHVFKLDRHLGPAQMQALALRLKQADARIDYVEPDRKMYALAAAPNDSSYAQQWDLFEATAGINAPAAWDRSSGTGVVVAVIDTGIRPHADLVGQTVAGYDMINNATIGNDGSGRDADPSDPGDWTAADECGAGSSARNSSWHGTHVAGTIAAKANNALGIAGIAYNARVQPVRVLGKCGGYTSDIADAMVWASGGSVSGVPANATPARVLNLSLGGSGACDVTTQNAINSARARGTVIVVAAGNSNTDASNANPANCTGVVAVAALDRYGARAYYSNYGVAVDLAAPGGDARSSASNGIYSTLNAGTTGPGADSYAYYQGTSMAAPHVAGVAALMFSLKPGATPDEIEAALKSSARPFAGVCTACGAGMLDAGAAIVAVAGALPTAANEVEPNNTLSAANAVASPLTVSGSMASGDTDYFKVSLPPGKTLVSTLNAASSTNDFDLYLYNSTGGQLASSIKGAGSTDSLSYANNGSAAITLYVRVVYYRGSGTYSLKMNW